MARVVKQILAAAFIIGIGIYSRIGLETSRAQFARELVAPPLSIKYMTFGYNHAFADALWIRSLQDFDYCEKTIKQGGCVGKGWLFQMLDLMTDLSPMFRMAYSAGGMALTVVVSDVEGASRLFDKAVLEFPNDWIILYKAAYHAIFEEKKPGKAAALIERAAQNGAPMWTYSLAARLYTEAGRKEFARQMLEDLKKRGDLNEALIQRIEEKLSIDRD